MPPHPLAGATHLLLALELYSYPYVAVWRIEP
jgi:hypothetical protein